MSAARCPKENIVEHSAYTWVWIGQERSDREVMGLAREMSLPEGRGD